MDDFKSLLAPLFLLFLTSTLIVGCRQSQYRDDPMQSSEIKAIEIEPNNTEQIIILVPTFTPTASATPTLEFESTPPADPAIIAMHTITPCHAGRNHRKSCPGTHTPCGTLVFTR